MYSTTNPLLPKFYFWSSISAVSGLITTTMLSLQPTDMETVELTIQEFSITVMMHADIMIAMDNDYQSTATCHVNDIVFHTDSIQPESCPY